jgi:hypothetical protein
MVWSPLRYYHKVFPNPQNSTLCAGRERIRFLFSHAIALASSARCAFKYFLVSSDMGDFLQTATLLTAWAHATKNRWQLIAIADSGGERAAFQIQEAATYRRRLRIIVISVASAVTNRAIAFTTNAASIIVIEFSSFSPP